MALKAHTLTNLYNTRPQWLADAHANLDAAVAEAYGRPSVRISDVFVMGFRLGGDVIDVRVSPAPEVPGRVRP